MNEKNKRITLKTVIAMISMSLVVALATSGCKVMSTQKENCGQVASKSHVSSEALLTKETENGINIRYSMDDEDEYSGLSYQDLMQTLDEIAASKKFDEVEYKYAKTVIDKVYENYDAWRSVSIGFPSKEKFIYENILDTLRHCLLHFVSTESDEGKQLWDDGSALGFTEQFGGNAMVTIVYDPNGEEQDFLHEAERFLHELAHVRQRAVVFEDDHFSSLSFLRMIFIEGGATFKMKMMNPCQPEKMAYGFIESGNTMLEYELDNGEGYPKEMNYFCHLLCLAGYDVMEGIILGDPVTNVESGIAERYGADTAKELLRLFRKIELADLEENDAWEFRLALELENLILDCLRKDMEKQTTKEEIEIFTNKYRAYMIHLLPRISEDVYNEITFDPGYLTKAKELDALMADKIYASGAFGLNSISAADSLVHTSVEMIYERLYDFYRVFIPANLDHTKYLETEDGALILGYYNNIRTEEIEYVYLRIKKERETSEVQSDLVFEYVDFDPADLQDFYH